MARKKIEPIVGIGHDPDNKLMVQKSRPLFALWRSNLTLAEFKILDTYLSRIDSRKPDGRTIILKKGEIEDLLGVKRIRTEELDARIEHLCTTVKIEDSTVRKGFTRISLFEKAVAEQDENGLWQVELTCTPSAMKYIFNIENLGYLRYKLRCITSLTSRYTYIMFVYLESNRYRKTWEISLQDLKAILDCDKEELYKEYKRFNEKILKRVQKEMIEKTECKYIYEPIKKGRSVVKIKFTVETLTVLEEDDTDPNQVTMDQWLDNENVEHDLWKDALFIDGVCEFNNAQLDEIQEILVTIPAFKLPKPADADDDIDLGRYHYMAQKYKAFNRRDGETSIKNHFAYFSRMLKQDAGL